MRPTFLSEIPPGRAGVVETLRRMRALILRGKMHPAIRELAVTLTNHLPPKDFAGEIAALHAFVRDRIRYVRDTNGVETLHTPEAVLEIGSGDCDDKVVLLASLLEAIGHPTRSIAIALSPGKYSHVMLETKPTGFNHWIPLETTEMVPVGWKPPGITDQLIQLNGDGPNMEGSLMAILRPLSENPAEHRTLRRGSDRFGQGRTRVHQLINNAVDLDRTYEVLGRGTPERELMTVLRRVLSPEYGYQANLGGMNGCNGCGGMTLGEVASDAEVQKVAKEILDIWNAQRARAKSYYNGRRGTYDKAIASAKASLQKSLSGNGKGVFNEWRFPIPAPDNFALIRDITAQIAANSRYRNVLAVSDGVVKSIAKAGIIGAPLNIIQLNSAANAGLAAQNGLKLLDRLYQPVPESVMLDDLRQGKFKIFTNCDGKYKNVHTQREMDARSPADTVSADFRGMYVRDCPSKSLGDQLKEVAVPLAIMIAVPYAITALTGGAAVAASAPAAAAPAAAASTAVPLATTAIPSIGAGTAAAGTGAALSTLAVPSAGAVGTGLTAAGAVSTIAKVADTVSSAAPAVLDLQRVADAVKQDQGKTEPLVIPIDKGQEPAQASGMGNFLVPALIGGALLLLSMRG